MTFFHDSRDEKYRSPFGAVREGEKITLSAASEGSVTLRLWINEKEQLLPMKEDKHGLWSASFFADCAGIIWYYFIAGDESGEKRYCAPPDLLGGKSVLHRDGTPLDSHQITVYKKDFTAPCWMRESVMYQIFPDRFFDGADGRLLKNRSDIFVHNTKTDMPYCVSALDRRDPNLILTDDFYGGNLIGIEKKLDYIKEMGFSAIYLNPIFAANSNHKYDTGDYHSIDPTFGTNEDFKRLCEKAEKMGIRIILDGVFSHTGSDSIYFNKENNYDSLGAYQSEKSPYFTWYNFEKHPDKYDAWWGFETLPNVNEMHPDYLDFILRNDNAVIKKWLKMGASGWRLDVADELPDEFIEILRENVKKQNPDAAIIGEVWEDATNKVSYGMLRRYAHGGGLDSVMNYPLRDGLIGFFLGHEDSFMLKRRLDSQRENFIKEMYYSLMNLMGSHDRSRIINILGECDDQRIPRRQQRSLRMSAVQYELGKSRLKKMAEAVFALPGMPCVYYGDEAGLQGMRDPFCRAFFPWGYEDRDLQDYFARLIHKRNSRPVLRTGFVKINAPEPDIIEISRWFENGKDAFGNSTGGCDDAIKITIDRR